MLGPLNGRILCQLRPPLSELRDGALSVTNSPAHPFGKIGSKAPQEVIPWGTAADAEIVEGVHDKFLMEITSS
jgi:hypothetical protein